MFWTRPRIFCNKIDGTCCGTHPYSTKSQYISLRVGVFWGRFDMLAKIGAPPTLWLQGSGAALGGSPLRGMLLTKTVVAGKKRGQQPSFQPSRSEEGQRQVDEPGAGGQGLEGAQPVEVCFEEQRRQGPFRKGFANDAQGIKVQNRERVRQRQRKYGKKLRASRGEMSLLEMNSRPEKITRGG